VEVIENPDIALAYGTPILGTLTILGLLEQDTQEFRNLRKKLQK
jgi:hypothetical protein